MTERTGRVIDAEKVENTETETLEKDRKADEGAQKKASAPRRRSADWLARLLGAVALAGVAVVWANRQELTQLIESQNKLDARLAILEKQVRQQQPSLEEFKKRLKEFEDQLEALNTEVDALNEKVLNPANEPVITKGEVEQLKKQLDAMQQRMATLAERWQKTLKELMPPPGEADQALKPLQQQLQQLGERLGKIFEQSARPATGAAGKAAGNGLDPLTLQQWLLRVNTEWLLNGDVKQTRERLHAIEQAVQLSDLPNESKIAVLRAIGRDLAYLDSYEKRSKADAKALEPLRKWIKSLQPPKSATVDKNGQAAGESLTERLKGLVEIRRRSEGPSTPEQLMTFDLFKQRALLLVDEMAWAYMTHHEDLFVTTQGRLWELFQRQYPARLADLEARMKDLPKPVKPKPLSSAEAL
ncbi:hypothetical protein [Sulfurivirga sp.]|uniref:hypothetical protein n=1 Tax=Sulfurivirga sp. TaxID=2614236 RepID=UPI0025F95E3F|nr:hypothetical protein [Sulfurivirga sp.]